MMPGATPVFGITYPLLGETVDPVAFKTFADSVDAAVRTVDAQLEGAVSPTTQVPVTQRLYTRVAANFSTTYAVNVEASVTWLNGTGQWVDNGGLFSAGSPTLLTIQQPGIYAIHVSEFSITSFTTNTSFRVLLYQNAIARWGNRQNENGNSSSSPKTTFSGLLQCIATDTLAVKILWGGTGGPATIEAGTLQVRYVCPSS